MVYAVESVAAGEPLTVELLLEIHRRLLRGPGLRSMAVAPRGAELDRRPAYNPCSAAFVPPPPEQVPGLLGDLCAFCNDDALPAVAQAAIAHAQFETIHPFVDGNGRVGRALIHLILRRRGVVSRVLPPVSLVLATWSSDYIAALTATRYRGCGRLQGGRGRTEPLGRAVRRGDQARCGRRRRVRAADPVLEQTWRERSGGCALARPPICCCVAFPARRS